MAKMHGWKMKKNHFAMGASLDEKKKIKIIKALFRKYVGYTPDLDNPKSFNEKIIWYKLFYQDPRMTECADKYAVKDYVTRVIGPEHVVPTLAMWENPDDIDFDLLPERFVLKVNWSSGYYIIVKDKSKFDQVEVRKKLKKWMEPARNSYFEHFNWAYKYMKPVVFAEEYLEQGNGQVYDYKFFICGGELGFTLIVTDRQNQNTTGITMDYFDENFGHYDLVRAGSVNADPPLEKPKKYDEMVSLAKKLAKPFPFVRVDFYEVQVRILLGEMTFYTAGGLKPFEPRKWDFILGEKIPLPEKLITDKEHIWVPLRRTLHTFRARIVKRIIRDDGVYLVFLNRYRFSISAIYNQ